MKERCDREIEEERRIRQNLEDKLVRLKDEVIKKESSLKDLEL
jgi:hypothetical protein